MDVTSVLHAGIKRDILRHLCTPNVNFRIAVYGGLLLASYFDHRAIAAPDTHV